MINIQKSKRSMKSNFNYDDFVFGVQPTDNILLCNYKDGSWQSPSIMPYADIKMSPMSLCLHYGQTVFEGMKAFRQDNGQVIIFRPDKHFRRFNASLERMCMPAVGQDLFIEGIKELVRLEEHWLPEEQEISLYIRPFMIATEPRLGVKVSDEYLFCIVCTPMGLYYPEPIRLKVETEFVRAAEGGVGYVKCGGNYGAAFYPAQQAKIQGYDQVIWTDAKTHEYIEEAGTMNIAIVIDNRLITPKLSTSILDGVTRSSIIQIARDMGMIVEERKVQLQELIDEFQSGKKIEIFGVGTAAVISPVKCINILGTEYHPYTANDATMFKLKKQLDNIRKGRISDKYNWNWFI